MYFYGSNPGHFGKDPLWTLEPLFEQIRLRATTHCYIQNLKQLGPEKKMFKNILLANPGSLGSDHFDKKLNDH